MSYLQNAFGLNGKTAIVTGGAGTLCGAMAQAYVESGANVILWDIRKEAIDLKIDTINKSTKTSGKVLGVVVDLMSEESIASALKESVAKFGQIDVLINGAGGNRGKTALVDIKAEDFEFVMKLNLMAGCILPTKHFAKYLIDNNVKGCIINIASMSGFNPLSGVFAYSASKAAVMNQTMAHAKELAQYGIRVNAIAPGFFVADQNRKLLLNDDGSLTDRGKSVISHTPMRRFGEPEDLLGVSVFLASNSASFISGITLAVDGAYLCDNI